MSSDSIWGKSEKLVSAPKCITDSEVANGNDYAVGFSDWQMKLEGEDVPLYLVQTLSLRVPVDLSTQQNLIGYANSITYGFNRTAGARVSLLLDAAGCQHVLEIPFDVNGTPPSIVAMNFWRTFSHQEFGYGTFGPVRDYTITITAIAERKSKTESVLLGIDALDITAIFR